MHWLRAGELPFIRSLSRPPLFTHPHPTPHPPQGRAPPSFGNFSTGISKHNNAGEQKQKQDQSEDQEAGKPQSLKKNT